MTTSNPDIFSRSIALMGNEGMMQLQQQRVILFGVGGVGSWCAEALVRTGLTHLTIVDDDEVQASNINRQLQAMPDTIGRPKVEVLRERLQAINPAAEIEVQTQRWDWQTPFEEKCARLAPYRFVIDAIDSVWDKADMLLTASQLPGVRVFSSMGAALRYDPTQIRVHPFSRVSGDGLARALRQRFKRLGQQPGTDFLCICSAEPPMAAGRDIKGSLMPVTAAFGCALASLVLREMEGEKIEAES